MRPLDWAVLFVTQAFIVSYGIYKSRASRKTMDGYLLSGRDSNWLTVGLSIMATQASAITFLSAPGQAFTEGMGFVQFYFGLPLAMIILCIFAVPLYARLRVFTAYEFLEKRFDLKTRVLAAILFLSQRGLAAGFTIFAPSLILSSLLGWDIYWTNFFIGMIVIVYTVTGGSKAVNQTQKTQMTIILFGMFLAGYLVVQQLPKEVGFDGALHLAGTMGKLNAIDFSFNWEDKYNVWTGLIGGLFLMLSYFGTDQSQVQRYLGGKNVAQSRLGLIFNGMLKIPMQFAILFIGAMVFVFYTFVSPPAFFNKVLYNKAKETSYQQDFQRLEENLAIQHEQKKQIALSFNQKGANDAELATQLQAANLASDSLRKEVKTLIEKAIPNSDTNDTNYIFLTYVVDFLPVGLVGLIISVIFSASMSSTASELNALASTTVIDIYKRLFKPNASDEHTLKASKIATLFWGLYAIAFSMFANRLGTLIEAVNILGSLVYGTILGIFMVAFFFKGIGARAVFIAAIISETLVIFCWRYELVPFLWFNVIGSLAVVLVAFVLQKGLLTSRGELHFPDKENI